MSEIILMCYNILPLSRTHFKKHIMWESAMCPTDTDKALKKGRRADMALTCSHTLWMQCCSSSPSKSLEAPQIALNHPSCKEQHFWAGVPPHDFTTFQCQAHLWHASHAQVWESSLGNPTLPS